MLSTSPARATRPLTLSVAIIAVGFPFEALASDDRWRVQPYAGGTVGGAYDASSYDLGAGSTVVREVSSAFGGNAFAGVKFGPYVGFELSRLQLGALGVEAETVSGLVDTVRGIGVTSFNLAGFVPLGERWELTARLGIALDASYSTGQTCYSRSGRSGFYRSYPCQSTSYLFGAGARYAIDDHWGLRLDYLYVDFQDSRQGPNYKPQYLGIGVDYRF